MSDNTRLINIESMLKHFDKRITELERGTVQPATRTPRLVEACEMTLAYARNIDTEAVFESFHAMELALAAEKKRQELVNWLISVAKGHRYKATNLDIALRAIENYEKGEAG